MPGGLGPRFALEAGFLIVLAAVAAYARLDAAEIILIMAGGWLLASVFEVLAAWRERLYPGAMWERRVEAHEAPAAADEEAEAAREPVPRSQPQGQATPAPPVEGSASASEAAPSGSEPAQVENDATGEIELPKRRRWFRRGGEESETPPSVAEARPSARHVRLIRDSEPEEDREPRKDAEAGA